MKFHKPKNGHYFHYCYECKHYEYERTVGCAHLGICHGVKSDPTPTDAYDKPCGLFENRKGRNYESQT